MNCNHFDKLVGLPEHNCTSNIIILFCGALLFDDDIMHSARKIIKCIIIVCGILAMLGSRCSPIQSDWLPLIIQK